METTNLEEEIAYWQQNLKHIEREYKNAMTIEWPKIREKRIIFYQRNSKVTNETKGEYDS